MGRLAILRTFGQGEHARALAFSPDGTILASAAGNSQDFAVRLWQVPNGLPQTALEGHSSIVWDIAFSPDGRRLASASKDRTARLWDPTSGSEVVSLRFPDEVTSVAFSPNGQVLAVGGVDSWPDAAIWIHAAESGQLLRKLHEFWNIPDIAFTPDSIWLVGGGTSRNVRVWNVADGQERSVLNHAGQVSSLAVSPDGTTMAAGLCQASQASRCTRGAVWLWNLSAGSLRRQLADFPDWVEGVAFSPDGTLLFAGSRDGSLRVYATADEHTVFEAQSPGGIFALALSSDGAWLATGRSDGSVELWAPGP